MALEQLDAILASSSYLGSSSCATLADYGMCGKISVGSFQPEVLPHLQRWHSHVSYLMLRYPSFDRYGRAIPVGHMPLLELELSKASGSETVLEAAAPPRPADSRMHPSDSVDDTWTGCKGVSKATNKASCTAQDMYDDALKDLDICAKESTRQLNSAILLSKRATASSLRDVQATCATVAESAYEVYDEEEWESGRLPTGLVHAMGIEHTRERRHPECKERVCMILAALEKEGLRGRCQELDLRSARHEELERAHDRAHVQNMTRVSNMTARDLKDLEDTLDSVYLTAGSFQCASDASGAVIELVEKVLWGELSNGFAVVRPPGHHAESNEACGFCIFNHVAVAAEAAKSLGGGRVLIVDWDVHHGNGTQQIFESDPSVLVFNVHRYDDAQFFPCSTAAAPSRVGQDKGEGFNVNVAWNVRRGDYDGMGDDDYLAAWQCALLPIAYEFRPDLILVSAGFDATKGDPLGGCSVTPALYGQMTRMLQKICPKVVLVLEGGYNLSATAECAVSCTRALLGDPVLFRTSSRPKDEARQALVHTLEAHWHFWSYLPDFAALRASTIPLIEMTVFVAALQTNGSAAVQRKAKFTAGKHDSPDAPASTNIRCKRSGGKRN
eukprot:TRINITY_DN13345_c0_g1_i1.p1 TRINITY_DN13345_c0_g1~~TRINITY_DN13345_c0_g1_i1.p1  ORF type:complete len:629 (-),score=82.60 TRINITY_DN13345_c0_g1_i1:89-1930(-)